MFNFLFHLDSIPPLGDDSRTSNYKKYPDSSNFENLPIRDEMQRGTGDGAAAQNDELFDDSQIKQTVPLMESSVTN